MMVNQTGIAKESRDNYAKKIALGWFAKHSMIEHTKAIDQGKIEE